MNILIFSQHFWPEQFRINEVAKKLSASGSKVYVLTGQPNYPTGKIFRPYKNSVLREFYGDVEVYRVPMLPRYGGSSINLILNYTSFILSSFLLSPILLRKIHLDAILVFGTSPAIQGLGALPIKYIKKAKLLLWVQDIWPDDLIASRKANSKLLIYISQLAIDILYRKCDYILCQSSSFIDKIVSRVNTVKIGVLNNPCEASVFEWDNTCCDKHDISHRKFNVVYAGNIGFAQSIDTLILAAQELVDEPIDISIYGTGSQHAYFVNECRRRNLSNVKFFGHVCTEIMPAVYATADCLVFTLGPDDNLSATIPSRLQAFLAARKPIVAAVNGAANLLIRTAKCGEVVDSEDFVGLAAKILKIQSLTDEDRLELGRNGRIFAEENFSPSIINDRLLQYIRDTL